MGIYWDSLGVRRFLMLMAIFLTGFPLLDAWSHVGAKEKGLLLLGLALFGLLLASCAGCDRKLIESEVSQKAAELKKPGWRFFVPMVLTMVSSSAAQLLPSWRLTCFLVGAGLAAIFFGTYWRDPWVRRSFLALVNLLAIFLLISGWDRWADETRAALGIGYSLLLFLQYRCWDCPTPLTPLARGWRAIVKRVRKGHGPV
ncbi:MAG: hypothetical protein KM310_07935 [Clostridiales bacterium]|nr:hypothetical protein [Clostridiales bacterium]